MKLGIHSRIQLFPSVQQLTRWFIGNMSDLCFNKHNRMHEYHMNTEYCTHCNNTKAKKILSKLATLVGVI